MRKTGIIFKVLIIIISILLILPNNVKAFGLLDAMTEWFDKDDITLDTDIQIGNTEAIKSSNGMIKIMLGVMQAIGSVASIIALIIIGFRYMFASVEGKAEMKGVLIYYIIGAVLVFATANILGIVYDIITGLTMA